MNKDQWVEEIISTAKQTEAVKANPSLYEHINRRLEHRPAAPMMPVKWIYAAAVAVGILVIANIAVWKNLVSETKINQDAEYQTEFSLTTNNAYSLNY